ncbi:MAG TPA: SH3 domain-containing protein [Blastocatellia bacterium]|nr:SH3 domain-containing protein [Blastocatellia bacterium]
MSAGIGSQTASTKERITTASGVRVRAAPQTTAEEVTRLPLGTILQVLEQSAGKEKVGQNEDFWYRVTTTDGKSGWVFGSLTGSFDPANREAIYQGIAAERLKVELSSFAEQVDLVNFLTRVVTEVTTPAIAAELELSRLVALRRSVSEIPAMKPAQPSQQAWLRAQERQLLYSEPGGQWIVNSELFWNLQRKYRALPIAERIAWEASQNLLPGECETDLPCNFEVIMLREGRYLELYPQGAHAEEALSNLDDLLKTIAEDTQQKKLYEVAREDRATFGKNVARLRAVLMKTTGPKKTAVLKSLDQIAQAFH